MTASTPHPPQRLLRSGKVAVRGIGVALVDSEPLFREGLSALIRHTSGLQWLGATQDMRSAVAMSERLHPDAMIIDAVMDPHSQLARILTSTNAGLTVIALVRDPYRTPEYLAEARAAGVRGVLLRSAEPTLLVDAIRRASIDGHFVGPRLSGLAQGQTVRARQAGWQSLSRREYQVLRLIADGLDNQAIGKTLFVSVETVRTHVKGILRKLHARDRAHAISLAYRIGVLVVGCEPAPDPAAGTDSLAPGQLHNNHVV